MSLYLYLHSIFPVISGGQKKGRIIKATNEANLPTKRLLYVFYAKKSFIQCLGEKNETNLRLAIQFLITSFPPLPLSLH